MTTPQPTPEPTPPHIIYPAGPPEDLQPFPMYPEVEPNPDGTFHTPQYPPYIPEQQFDTSQGMPRSTLDGIHGTGGDDPIRWSPSFPGELPPYGMHDYVQDRNDPDLWWPDHRPDAPGSTHPAGYQKTAPDGKSGKDVFEVNYHHLEGLAQGHDAQAGQVAQWADAEKDFADRLLATHGKVAYATYLNVKGFNESRQVEAGAYAQRNADTAVGLRGAIESTRSTDESSAAAFKSPTTSI
ncbi:ESX-1 secretion-associated protein (plasmid) [Mycobacterium avium subsp. hominissuis]|uniref:type VII secretion target n=1 Tax=Mycobacterium avium TaxID=1764 RepID=UPI003140C0B4